MNSLKDRAAEKSQLLRAQAKAKRDRYEALKHLPVPHTDYWHQTLSEIASLESEADLIDQLRKDLR